MALKVLLDLTHYLSCYLSNFSCLSSPPSLHLDHNGLLAGLRTHEALALLWSYAFSVSSAWNSLPPDFLMAPLSSSTSLWSEVTFLLRLTLPTIF